MKCVQLVSGYLLCVARDSIFLFFFKSSNLFNTFIDDVIKFYETPVNAILPLDELKTRKLPPNLHIEHNYTRFNPETDTIFNGHTAFPKSSTIVTGITYRKKYPGYDASKKNEFE